MKKCVFFDRDGIVNQSPGPGYVECWADFELMPEFVDILRLVRSRGYEAVIITNQRGVARGIMSMATVDDIHSRLKNLLKEEHGLDLLDIFCCPHDKGVCECRKPLPGMLFDAAGKHNINLAESWMVGDRETDVEAGAGAGCRTIIVTSNEVSSKADFSVSDMTGLERVIAKLL
ncbi:MAG: HAD family hydrolase [Kiritimatiellae bacterium]|nr:HAD family hydrolase [Kiritimatiellia bacterium]